MRDKIEAVEHVILNKVCLQEIFLKMQQKRGKNGFHRFLKENSLIGPTSLAKTRTFKE